MRGLIHTLTSNLLVHSFEFLNQRELFAIPLLRNKKIFLASLRLQPRCPTYFDISPYDLSFTKQLCTDFESVDLNNCFCVFNDSVNRTLLAYSKVKTFEIQIVNVCTGKLVQSLSGHLSEVTFIRAFDYLLLSSSYDGSYRVWDIDKHYECLLVLVNPNNSIYLFSGLITNHRGVKYIITSASEVEGMIKIFDFTGKCLFEYDYQESIEFLDFWQHPSSSEQFIISAGKYNVRFSQMFEKDPSKHKYFNSYFDTVISVEVVENLNNIEIAVIYMESRGHVLIDDYNSGNRVILIDLLIFIRSSCIWNKKYLIISGSKEIRLVELEDYQNFTIHENCGEGNVQKGISNKYGEMLFYESSEGVISMCSLRSNYSTPN